MTKNELAVSIAVILATPSATYLCTLIIYVKFEIKKFDRKN
jgi:hypothetical protein